MWSTGTWRTVLTRQSVSILLTGLVLLSGLQSTEAYTQIDPNGCNITFDNNTSATTQNGVEFSNIQTVPDCLEYCIFLLSPSPCVAVEFDFKNRTFGCWVHTNPQDLSEIFSADDAVTNYIIHRSGCTVKTTRSAADSVASKASSRLTAAYLSLTMGIFMALLIASRSTV